MQILHVCGFSDLFLQTLHRTEINSNILEKFPVPNRNILKKIASVINQSHNYWNENFGKLRYFAYFFHDAFQKA